MFLKRTILFAALLIVLCGSSVQGLAQGQPPSSKRNKIVFDGDMGALLAQLAEYHHVNLSLETDPAHPKPKVKIDFWFDTLDDVLDGIILAAPGYRWRKQDGFIDVYPREASSILLETVVVDLQVDNNDWSAASQALTSLPEIVSQMKILGLTRRDFERRPSAGALFSLNLKNVTLRRALHEITMKSNNRFWIVERYGRDGRLISISNSLL